MTMPASSVLRNLRTRVAAAAAATALLVGPAGAADSIKIGVVVPITSALAAYGTPFVEAMKLAVEPTNKSGGINGKQVELVVEDSQASNTVAINALNRVLQSEPVVIFGPALGTQVLAMMPTTEKEKVPFIASPGTRRVTLQHAKYFFRAGTHDAIEKENWTRFIVGDLKKQRIGIIHVSNEWGYSGRDNTTEFLQKLYGLKPVSIAAYELNNKDYTAQIRQMVQDGADVIAVQGHPVEEALVLRQMRQQGVTVPHIGSGTLCMAYQRNLVTPEEIAGHYCEAPDMLPPLNERPQVQAFVEAYRKRTGETPDIYATHYYDATAMVLAIMAKYGVDREKIREGLREMTYEGVIGTYKSDEEGNLWHDAMVMEFSSDGKAKPVHRYQKGS
jgi:branched-chain amino acid transport system substrate-binding protein